MIELAEPRKKQIANIKVIGVGGAGGNTIDSLINSGCKDIGFVVANTDAQALEHSKAPQKIQIGVKSTKGLGPGANPDLGQRSAEEDIDKIMEAIGDADIVFLAGGMGGGTGSGALPVIARALKDNGILSIAIVTKPFLFEGKRRERLAQKAIEHLKQSVDTLIVIPNQNLIDIVDCNVSMIDSFSMINDILSQSVIGIADIITKPGHINVDFADVRAIMKDMGLAVLGTGRAIGENRAREATLKAISSPLLENMHIDGARGVLLNITGGKNLSLHEISQAASIIYEKADVDANIILGSVVDETLTDEIHVTIIATGFNNKEQILVKELATIKEIVPIEEPHPVIAPMEPTRVIYELTPAQEVAATPLSHVELNLQPAAPEKVIVHETISVKNIVPAQEVAQDIQHDKHDMTPVEKSVPAAEPASDHNHHARFAPSETHDLPAIDVNDFDVPAFLRHKVQQNKNVDQ